MNASDIAQHIQGAGMATVRFGITALIKRRMGMTMEVVRIDQDTVLLVSGSSGCDIDYQEARQVFLELKRYIADDGSDGDECDGVGDQDNPTPHVTEGDTEDQIRIMIDRTLFDIPWNEAEEFLVKLDEAL